MSSKRISSVRLIWLEAFVAAVECGSYEEACTKLSADPNPDPTGIKRYINQLEDWLGKSLIMKSKREPTLTEDGREFLSKAKTVIELLYTSRDFYFDSSNIHEAGKFMGSFLAKHMRDRGE